MTMTLLWTTLRSQAAFIPRTILRGSHNGHCGSHKSVSLSSAAGSRLNVINTNKNTNNPREVVLDLLSDDEGWMQQSFVMVSRAALFCRVLE